MEPVIDQDIKKALEVATHRKTTNKSAVVHAPKPKPEPIVVHRKNEGAKTPIGAHEPDERPAALNVAESKKAAPVEANKTAVAAVTEIKKKSPIPRKQVPSPPVKRKKEDKKPEHEPVLQLMTTSMMQ